MYTNANVICEKVIGYGGKKECELVLMEPTLARRHPKRSSDGKSNLYMSRVGTTKEESGIKLLRSRTANDHETCDTHIQETVKLSKKRERKTLHVAMANRYVKSFARRRVRIKQSKEEEASCDRKMTYRTQMSISLDVQNTNHDSNMV